MARNDTHKEPVQDFELKSFFPYQTRLFYKYVSDAVSHVYEERYDMKPYEWRAIAILGTDNALTPAEIVDLSSMDKVSVSRAISKLQKRGWLLERTKKSDARSKVLKLSAAGKSAYNDLVPLMLEVEKKMLSELTETEAFELRRLMAKLLGDQ